MRTGMAVAAYYCHAGLGNAKLGAYYMYNALVLVAKAVKLYVMVFAVFYNQSELV